MNKSMLDFRQTAVCHGHAPVDAVHHLLGGPHTLVSRRLLDDQADESQSLLAQASRGLDSKREEARAHLISQPTVLPVLLSLGLLQHSLAAGGTVCLMSNS